MCRNQSGSVNRMGTTHLNVGCVLQQANLDGMQKEKGHLISPPSSQNFPC